MADIKVSHRYATSLLETAIEKNKLDKVSVDMLLLVDVLEENKKLQLALESPVIKPEVKSAVMREIFKEKFDSDSLSFIDFVIGKNRENLLYSIALRFLDLRDDHLGVAKVSVSTAYDFTDEQKNILKDKLEDILNKKVRLSFVQDKELIGGFIAKVGDTNYDASIQHQLKLLKKKFMVGGISLN